MEQLLFELDYVERDKIDKRGITKDEIDAYQIGFDRACSYKNNQMQEFDKWKGENGWIFSHDPYVGGKDYIKLRVRKSFSELFEIFIKETLNK